MLRHRPKLPLPPKCAKVLLVSLCESGNRIDPRAQRRASFGSVVQTSWDIADEADHPAVIWGNASQLLGVLQSRDDIPGITVERCQGEQGVTIIRIPDQILFQDCDGFINPAGRMQRDGVYIGVSQPGGFE